MVQTAGIIHLTPRHVLQGHQPAVLLQQPSGKESDAHHQEYQEQVMTGIPVWQDANQRLPVAVHIHGYHLQQSVAETTRENPSHQHPMDRVHAATVQQSLTIRDVLQQISGR